MMRQLLLDIRPIASPSLNNFIAGANRELLNHLRGMAADHSATATYLQVRAPWLPRRGHAACISMPSRSTTRPPTR